MKKVIMCVFFVLLLFSFPISIKAEPTEGEYTNEFSLTQNEEELTCTELLGDTLLQFLLVVFTGIRIAAPIILIVTGILDFTGAVGSADGLAKASKKFILRSVACALIFFVPMFVKLLGTIMGYDLSCL